ncbi:MAG: GNAT family N-acetyltransferase [Lacunisphaera sp.]
MSLTQLDWDSDFFRLKIGKIDLQGLDLNGLDQEICNARNRGYSLLYLFGSLDNRLHPDWQNENGCNLVDTKVTYEKFGLRPKITLPGILSHETDKIEQLYELAYESGKYSRFKLDHRFGSESFKSLYRAWVDNSVSRMIADHILVYKEGHSVCGFCTVRRSNDKATIGLIAVSPQHQGRGIGRNLCEAVEAWSVQHGCQKITVATQMANEGACRFYEKMGMAIVESMDIYHLWLNTNDPL